MKNLYNIFFVVAIMMATTVGCVKTDIDELQTTQNEDIVELRVAASIPSSDTRVDINGLEIRWNESDKIAVAKISDNGSFKILRHLEIDKNSISEDGKYAEFVVSYVSINDLLDKGARYIAYNDHYYSGVESISNYNIENLVRYRYDYRDISNDNIDIMMQSNSFEFGGDTLPQLHFEPKSSILELDIRLNKDNDYNGEIKKIEISSNSGKHIFLENLFFNSYGEYVYAFDKYGNGTQAYASKSIELGLTHDAKLSSSTTVSQLVPITWNGYITDVHGDFIFTIITADGKESKTTKPIKILKDGVRYRAELYFDEPQDAMAKEREALIDLYNSTNGDNWTNNKNWCTDAPLKEWYGVSVDYDGKVTNLSFFDNQLSGSIPESIGNLSKLEGINFQCNQLTGPIPESIGSLLNLEWILMYQNKLSGPLPESIGNLCSLKTLSCSYNQLTGSIPESIGNLTNLEDISLDNNKLTGKIPETLSNRPDWNKIAWNILVQEQGYGFSSIPDVYLEPSTITTIEDKTINTEDFFNYNKVTCVVLWRSWCGWSTYYMETIKTLFNMYATDGFGLISLNDEEDLSTITSYVDEYEIPGHVCQLHGNFFEDGSNQIKYMPTFSSPTFAFVDSNGKVIFSESIYPFDNPTMTREQATVEFMEDYFGKPSYPQQYESTDYSRDGEVLTLQQATVGKGIDIVILGDGFVDIDMETNGKYETRMYEAMEHFFSEEPYTSFRDRYNVYAVKAISKNSDVNGISETIFGSEFGEGTHITGNNNKVFDYALKVPDISSIDDLTVLTVLNSKKYAGTCWMYYNGATISYCPIPYNDSEQFRQIVNHECGGHGFGKLLDEYGYPGTITYSAINEFKKQKELGWGANVDITDNPSTIQWAHFLTDSRYDGQVGIYEGALTFEFGAYRPTDSSIMNINIGGYNAPSRELIYKNIMRLSGYEYSYEEFIEYDAINRSASANAYRTAAATKVDKKTFIPLGRPMIIEDAPTIVK